MYNSKIKISFVAIAAICLLWGPVGCGGDEESTQAQPEVVATKITATAPKAAKAKQPAAPAPAKAAQPAAAAKLEDPTFGGKLRDLTPADLATAVDYDEPTYIRRKKIVGESAGSIYRGIVIDNNDLDVPTSLRRKAD